jgi:beta-galactosidase
MRQDTVQVTQDGLRVGEQILPLHSGSFQYWRNERSAWGKILREIRSMGFRIVETYTPWGVHEREPGKYDFGSIDAGKDIGAFLRLCADNGLYVSIRPGPNYIAELPWFGIPERVVKDTRIQARTSGGAPAVLIGGFFAPFAAPSYACELFYDEARPYFRALCALLSEYLYPRGPIVLVQADNENSFFFRTSCYDLDYHPESVALYRSFLSRKYGSIEVLNRLYEARHDSFDTVDPPREFKARGLESLPLHLDWAEYKEYYLQYGLGRVKSMLEEYGVQGVPFYHNYPVIGPTTPFNISAVESVLDIAAVDCYPRPQSYEEIKTGAAYTSTMSRLPFLAEFLSGVWTFNKPLTVEEERFITQAVFMHGIRAVNYYMLVEREHWTGCPITRNGDRREGYFDLYRAWNERARALRLHTLRPERPLLLMLPRTYTLLESAAVCADFPWDFLLSFYFHLPSELFRVDATFGLRDAPQKSARPWLEAMRICLDRLGMAYAIADDTLSGELLSGYAVVFAPIFELCNRETWESLQAYVRAGGTAIVGPRLPLMDMRGDLFPQGDEPDNPLMNVPKVILEGEGGVPAELWLENADCRRPLPEDAVPGEAIRLRRDVNPPFIQERRIGRGRLFLLGCVFPEAHELPSGKQAYAAWAPWLARILDACGISPSWRSSNNMLDLAVMSSKEQRVVWIANPTPQRQTSVVSVPGADVWTRVDFWGNEPPRSESSEPEGMEIELEAYSISAWEVR